jgi:hypothetical protein
MNTWTWTATNISDVAVGLSNHYIWDAGSVIVDKAPAPLQHAGRLLC